MITNKYGAALVPGAHHYGGGGLGILGSSVPSTGEAGPAPLYPTLTFPDDANVEFMARIETWPVGLSSFNPREDSSFDAVGPDGFYSYEFRKFRAGVDMGLFLATFTIGVVAPNASFALTTDDAVFSGSAGNGPIASFSLTTGDAVFAGSAAGHVTVVSGDTMSMLDLIADLKASLQDAAKVFTAADDADFRRHVTRAADAFAQKRPRTVLTSATLQADVSEYDVPADFLSFKMHLWGVQPRVRPKPWERGWPGALPRVHYTEVAAGSYKLSLEPSPSDAQLAALGSDFRYYYFARHVVHETDGAQTTILPGERGLLLLRAQAEACRELALRGMTKPVQLRDGMSQAPRNSTPAALYAAFLKEFQETAL